MPYVRFGCHIPSQSTAVRQDEVLEKLTGLGQGTFLLKIKSRHSLEPCSPFGHSSDNLSCRSGSVQQPCPRRVGSACRSCQHVCGQPAHAAGRRQRCMEPVAELSRQPRGPPSCSVRPRRRGQGLAVPVTPWVSATAGPAGPPGRRSVKPRGSQAAGGRSQGAAGPRGSRQRCPSPSPGHSWATRSSAT
uniref:Uncharacterized protein n=1 Tax=Falco tinnunculus TaxID=100819 RepID=A0A8C4VAW9_FALTI